MNNKKQPFRLCVGCGVKKPKKDMVRIVKTAQDIVRLDLTGRENGRGAYICREKECIEKAQKTKGLEKSFKMNIPKETYQRLISEMEELDG